MQLGTTWNRLGARLCNANRSLPLCIKTAACHRQDEVSIIYTFIDIGTPWQNAHISIKYIFRKLFSVFCPRTWRSIMQGLFKYVLMYLKRFVLKIVISCKFLVFTDGFKDKNVWQSRLSFSVTESIQAFFSFHLNYWETIIDQLFVEFGIL